MLDKKRALEISENCEILYKKIEKYIQNLPPSNGDLRLNKNLLKEEIIIELIKKDIENRSIPDIYQISKFLEKTDIIRKISNDHSEGSNKKFIDKLIYFCSMNMTYHQASKNNIIFKEGDNGSDFYVIIHGKLEVQKNTESYVFLNAEEYFKLLKSISDNGYSYLALKSIKANKNSFNIIDTDEDIDKLFLICFLVRFRYYIKHNFSSKSYVTLFKEYRIDPNIFNLDLHNLDTNLDIKKPILLNAFRVMFDLYNISKIDLLQYSYIELSEIRKKIVIYNHETIMILNAGDCFGDFTPENKSSKRAASIYALEETHLGKISNDIYTEYISNENQKYKSKEIAFLINNYIFKLIPVKFFKKNYYPDFLRLDYPKYTFIMKQNNPIEYIYFIREGEVELNIELNLIQLNNLINSLLTKINYNNLPKVDEQNVFNNKEFYEKKRVFKIYIYENKEALGLESIILNLPSLYSARIITEKNKFYRLDVKKFNIIFNDNKDCYNCGINYAKSKILMLIKRLNELKTLTINGLKHEKIMLKNTTICIENKEGKTGEIASEKLEKNLLKTISSSNNFKLNYRNLINNDAFSFTQTFIMSEKTKSPSKFLNDNNDNKTVNNFKLNFNITNGFSVKRSSSEDIRIINHLKNYNRNVFNSTFIRTNSSKKFNKINKQKQLSLPRVSIVDPLGYDSLMKNEFPCLDTLINSHKEEMVKMIPENDNTKIEEPKKKFLDNIRINSVYYTSFYNPYKIDVSKFRHNYVLKKNKK